MHFLLMLFILKRGGEGVHAEASSEALQREFFAKTPMLMIDKGGDQRYGGGGGEQTSRLLKLGPQAKPKE